MMDVIEAFLEEHQLLLFSIVLPLMSAIVGYLSSKHGARAALKRLQSQQRFASVEKISDYRSAWIQELRAEISEFNALTQAASAMNVSQEAAIHAVKLQNSILMRINPDDPDFENLRIAISDALDRAQNQSPRTANSPSLMKIGARILKREWERLKSDLEGAFST